MDASFSFKDGCQGSCDMVRGSGPQKGLQIGQSLFRGDKIGLGDIEVGPLVGSGVEDELVSIQVYGVRGDEGFVETLSVLAQSPTLRDWVTSGKNHPSLQTALCIHGEDIGAFEIAQQYLIYKSKYLNYGATRILPDLGEYPLEEKFHIATKLYFLAKRLRLPQLEDAVYAVFLELEKYVTPGAVMLMAPIIYEKSFEYDARIREYLMVNFERHMLNLSESEQWQKMVRLQRPSLSADLLAVATAAKIGGLTCRYPAQMLSAPRSKKLLTRTPSKNHRGCKNFRVNCISSDGPVKSDDESHTFLQSTASTQNATSAQSEGARLAAPHPNNRHIGTLTQLCGGDQPHEQALQMSPRKFEKWAQPYKQLLNDVPVRSFRCPQKSLKADEAAQMEKLDIIEDKLQAKEPKCEEQPKEPELETKSQESELKHRYSLLKPVRYGDSKSLSNKEQEDLSRVTEESPTKVSDTVQLEVVGITSADVGVQTPTRNTNETHSRSPDHLTDISTSLSYNERGVTDGIGRSHPNVSLQQDSGEVEKSSTQMAAGLSAPRKKRFPNARLRRYEYENSKNAPRQPGLAQPIPPPVTPAPTKSESFIGWPFANDERDISSLQRTPDLFLANHSHDLETLPPVQNAPHQRRIVPPVRVAKMPRDRSGNVQFSIEQATPLPLPEGQAYPNPNVVKESRISDDISMGPRAMVEKDKAAILLGLINTGGNIEEAYKEHEKRKEVAVKDPKQKDSLLSKSKAFLQ